ncbi:hypothetical protein L1987_49568 [Smallanthus sonchifolius]|uniref:Uncharacterized protein n=1 Tax=Smallanthus sonchifolius TaxID=185202 RepID=A0ACB9FVX5_9ASTR|nr:hypothetical protein L1987_49568 [Smallanthus sonchifolius]
MNRGWSSVEIKYLTGFYVMLVFKSMEETERFWLDKELWTDVFASIDRWYGKQKLMDERIAWLQVHGVPLQLAIDQVFDLVGAQYGEWVPDCVEEFDYVSEVGTSLARKKFRRKALFKNRGEVTGSYERPKKRQRDDNDMFGLDKLISIVAPPSDHSFCGIRDSDEGLCTPDLNKWYDMGRENVEDEVDQEGREPNVVTNVFVGSKMLLMPVIL